MQQTSSIELSRSALQQNIRFLQKYVGAGTRISAVVKGNAYGHGIEQFVPLARECGIDHFSVFHAGEAQRVFQAIGDRAEIMVMGEVDPDDLTWLIERRISFYVFELERLREAVCTGGKIGQPARVHLQVETGMNRLGLTTEDLEEALVLCRNNPDQVNLEGICTHYAGAESVTNYVRVQKQIEHFLQLKAHLQSRGVQPRYWHSACSAALLNYPGTAGNLVRVGIALYGFWPSEETRVMFLKERSHPGKVISDPLKQVISWKSRVMAVKRVPRGEFIGYGTTYLATTPRVIAMVPVGYYDGYSRSLSNQGRVLVNGRRAGVVGVVNMNMMAIDVTDIPGVQRGDEVVIIGHQKRLRLTVTSFSDMTSYLNYEILTRLQSEIPRQVVD